MTYDLCLYGHLTIDHVFHGFQESVSLGAMANVWHALTILDSALKVKLCPLAIGEAIVVLDKEKSERVGRANLNIATTHGVAEQASWHHIMYLNALHDASFIPLIDTGIVSADITAGSCSTILRYLNYIDFLFIAEEDLFLDLDELSALVKGVVIVHSPEGSIVAKSDGKRKIARHPPIKHLNVLGAGDIFAASFISAFLSTQCLDESISRAHMQTTALLLDRNTQ